MLIQASKVFRLQLPDVVDAENELHLKARFKFKLSLVWTYCESKTIAYWQCVMVRKMGFSLERFTLGAHFLLQTSVVVHPSTFIMNDLCTHLVVLYCVVHLLGLGGGTCDFVLRFLQMGIICGTNWLLVTVQVLTLEESFNKDGRFPETLMTFLLFMTIFMWYSDA